MHAAESAEENHCVVSLPSFSAGPFLLVVSVYHGMIRRARNYVKTCLSVFATKRNLRIRSCGTMERAHLHPVV